jgi:SAM-dependent methyltransferase
MDEFDFDAILGDDYLYFFSERLSDERSDSAVETITSLLGLKAGDQVADVACGHGRISNRLAQQGIAVKGLDAAPLYLDTNVVLRSHCLRHCLPPFQVDVAGVSLHPSPGREETWASEPSIRTGPFHSPM